MKVLSQAEIEHFVEWGYVRLSEAFPRKNALAAQDFLWGKLAERGVNKQDRSTWTEPMVHIKEAYSDQAFQACASERLADAVEDLVGDGRWRSRNQTVTWGWWPVNFAVGADQPWDVSARGWHWDGIHFRHFVDSADQGLLLLCMFSETGPRGGGTLVAAGSHHIVARYLNGKPEGMVLQEAIGECQKTHPWLADLTGASEIPYGPGSRIERFMEREHTDDNGLWLKVMECTASPGDAYLCHPFLFHALSQNHSGVPRFMCNRTTPLKEKMHLHREEGAYSPVERSIRRGLGMDGRHL